VNEMSALRSMVVRVLLTIGIVGFALAGFAAFKLSELASLRFHGTVYPDAPPAPDFTLIDDEGEPNTLSGYHGSPVLLFFGFTRCADVCPRTLARLTRIQEEAAIPLGRMPVLLITVDPEHDTPDRLRDYTAQFAGRVRGLTGERQDVEGVFSGYGVFANPSESHAGSPTIAHTDLIFGIDAAGRLRVLIHADAPDDIIRADIETLLRLRS